MRQQPPAGEDATTTIIAAIAAATFGAGLVSWGAARTALVLTGDAHTRAPLSGSPAFVIRLLHGDAPDRAWADAYPGAAPLEAGLFWLVLGFLLLLCASVAALALTRWHDGQGRTSDPARWATGRQERRIAVPRDPDKRRWRLVAGRGQASHRLLAGADCVSAVVFGPNGSGKTTSLIVPNVADWDGPVVLTTAKPQDLAPIIRARGTRGPVWVIAPGGAPGTTPPGGHRSPLPTTRRPRTGWRNGWSRPPG